MVLLLLLLLLLLKKLQYCVLPKENNNKNKYFLHHIQKGSTTTVQYTHKQQNSTEQNRTEQNSTTQHNTTQHNTHWTIKQKISTHRIDTMMVSFDGSYHQLKISYNRIKTMNTVTLIILSITIWCFLVFKTDL